MNIERKQMLVTKACCLCDKHTLIHIADINDAPFFLGCTTKPESEDKFVTFKLYQCPDCHLIQTESVVTEAVYDKLHSEAVGGIWEKHHDAFAEFVKGNISGKASLLEIGPSSSPIAKKIKDVLGKVYYCDVLKTLPFDLGEDEEYIEGFFPDVKPKEKVDIIIASHVFEHATNMDSFFKEAMNCLNEQGHFIISIPDFEKWIGDKYWNGITREHTVYPFIVHLKYLASKHGVMCNVKPFIGHSVFFDFCKTHKPQGSVSLKEHALAEDWINAFVRVVEVAEHKLDEDMNIPVFITGASHLSQYPLLMSEKIRSRVRIVLDNSDSKNGLRLYGTNVIAKKFDYLKEQGECVVLIFPSPYQKEMAEQVQSLNQKAHAIVL